MVHTFRQTGVGLLSCCLDAAGVLPHQRGIDMGPAGDFGHVEEREIFKKRLEVVLVKEIYGSGFSAALLIFQFKSSGLKTAAPAINSYFILQPQSVTEKVIPEYTGIRRTYQFDISKLPVSSARTRSFFVYLRHTIAEVDIDGKTTVDTGEDQDVFHIGHTPGNYWLSIPIHDVYYEKPFSLTLTPVYNSVRNEQPVFYLIDREPLLNMIVLPGEMPLIAMSFFVITTGIFLMITTSLFWKTVLSQQAP